MNKNIKFWNKISKKYANQPIEDEVAYHHKLDTTKEYYNNETCVLEIGCATGGTAIIHAPNVKQYTAIDYCEPLLNVGMQQANDKHINNIAFIQTSIEEFKIEQNKYEMILALSVFHLLPNYIEVINNIYNALPENGVLISSTACLKDSPKILQWILPVVYKFGLAPLVVKFSGEELVQQMKQAGFKIEYQWQPSKGKALFVVAKK